ncbi:enoyl-CoA hydratase-related protein [Cupriavidus basilensis]
MFRFLQQISQASKPLVAAVKRPGSWRGHHDAAAIAIWSTPPRRRSLSLPFVQLGLCPEAASSMLLPRLLGHQRAAEKLLLGEAFSAQEALRDRPGDARAAGG